MRLQRFIFAILLLSTTSAIVSCADFQEEVHIPFGVSVNNISFDSSSSTGTVTVNSDTNWNVSEKPAWIEVKSIAQSTVSPYEWNVSFFARANGGYSREGTILINNKTESAVIKVSQLGALGEYIAVESVSLGLGALPLTVGVSAPLNYYIDPWNASDKSVTWASSNTSVATVSSSGLVTAMAVGSATITVTANDGRKKATCLVTVNEEVVPVKSVRVDKTSLTMTEGDTQTLTVTVVPDNATDKSVTWSSSNAFVATVSSSGVVTAKTAGTATITVTTTDGGLKATCAVTVEAIPEGVVDLGLSVKWATRNLGSSSPSDYGNFYAWGEINPKASNFQPNDYKWFDVIYTIPYSSIDGYDAELMIKIMKYSFSPEHRVPETDSKLGYYMTQFTERDYEDMPSQAPVEYDNIYVLQQEDDAARWELGKGWRIPTDEEWKELIEQCEWIPSTRNGVNGYIVTSKKNGASIFLPKAGFISGDTIIDQGSYGDYWSSSLSESRPFVAKSISCGQSGIWNREGWYRYDGLSIRPVYTK